MFRTFIMLYVKIYCSFWERVWRRKKTKALDVSWIEGVMGDWVRELEDEERWVVWEENEDELEDDDNVDGEVLKQNFIRSAKHSKRIE